MADVAYKVCVVTVTYGSRWQFLQQVLNRVLSFANVTNVVVVDNASAYSVEAKTADEKITVLTNADNEGSAGGYHQGIKYAFDNTSCDFIWLLDDDNVPEEGSLDILLAQWKNIPGADNKKALFCLRDDREQQVKIAKGENPYRYFLMPDNFIGFSLFNILENRRYKRHDKDFVHKPYKDHVSIPYVPYGGLLLHRDTVAEIGFPDERFHLYVDDSEYSYRITQHGGTIWLIPACRVIDVDKSQGINYKPRPFHSKLLDEWSFRTYYHIRNRMYFYSRVATNNKLMFSINKALYMGYLRVISLLSGKAQAYKKLKVAVTDGLQGDLGKASPDKF